MVAGPSTYALYVVPDNGFDGYQSISKGTNWGGAHITITDFTEGNKVKLQKFIDIYKTYDKTITKWNPAAKEVTPWATGLRQYNIDSGTLDNLKEIIRVTGVTDFKRKPWHIYCSTGLQKVDGSDWSQIHFSLIMVKKTDNTVEWLEDTRVPFLYINNVTKIHWLQNCAKQKW
jgi:hypothetical protein